MTDEQQKMLTKLFDDADMDEPKDIRFIHNLFMQGELESLTEEQDGRLIKLYERYFGYGYEG